MIFRWGRSSCFGQHEAEKIHKNKKFWEGYKQTIYDKSMARSRIPQLKNEDEVQ